MIPEEYGKYTFDEFTTNPGNIHDYYIFEEINVGQGASGQVRKVTLKKGFNTTFVVKTIKKEALNNQLTTIAFEMNTYKTLDHPNCVRFFESF